MLPSNLRSSDGSVTAEFMILIPWLLGLLALSLGMFRIGLMQIEASSTAHQIARLVARSDSLEVPPQFQETSWDINLLDQGDQVCVELIEPQFPLIEAKACAPSLGR